MLGEVNDHLQHLVKDFCSLVVRAVLVSIPCPWRAGRPRQQYMAVLQLREINIQNITPLLSEVQLCTVGHMLQEVGVPLLDVINVHRLASCTNIGETSLTSINSNARQ